MTTMIGRNMMDSKREQYLDTALRRIAADVRDAAPEAKRLDRGLLIALNRRVDLHEDGSADVQSDSDLEVFYHINAGMCECHDWSRAPEHMCKHRYSVALWCAALDAVKAMP